MHNGHDSNPIVACNTTSAQHCAKTSVSREANFAPGLQPHISQDQRPILHQASSLIYLKIQRRQVIMKVLHLSCARPPSGRLQFSGGGSKVAYLASAFSNYQTRKTIHSTIHESTMLSARKNVAITYSDRFTCPSHTSTCCNS